MQDLDEAVRRAKALGDPTRLRLLRVLEAVELTVGELCMVMEQSQPRVSRHLKLLADAGLVARQLQGSFVFYRRADDPSPRGLVRAALESIDPRDPMLQRDQARLGEVHAARAETAAAYFERIAPNWDHIRSLHVDEHVVEAAIAEAMPRGHRQRLLDLGTGTGRMLELLGERVQLGLGVDQSREMLHLARTRLDGAGLLHTRVREGNILDLDVTPGSFDVAIIHHVLHFLDEPERALQQAAKALRAGGALLVVDFASHDLGELRAQQQHRHLGFSEHQVERWCDAAGFSIDLVHHLRPTTADGSLTVTLWRARRVPQLAAPTPLEQAS